MKKVLLSSFAIVAAAASIASAQVRTATYTPGVANIPVKITVAPLVSVWTNDASEVTLTPAGATGFDGAARDLAYINNVDANVSVNVTGSLPQLEGGQQFNFFVFPNQASVPAAKAAVVLNNYNPAGALRWYSQNSNAIQGGSQSFGPTLPVNNLGSSIPVVYAVSTGGILSAPQSYELTVVYTIAPAN